jgi:hypothetical protein
MTHMLNIIDNFEKINFKLLSIKFDIYFNKWHIVYLSFTQSGLTIVITGPY